MISDSERKELIVLADAIDKTDKAKPARADLDKLRTWLAAHPAVADELGNLATVTQHNLLVGTVAAFAPSEQQFVKARLETMRDELDYDDASELAKSLIRHVMLCWVRLHEVELRFDALRTATELTLRTLEFWERRLIYAQRRFLRAAESLAKIQKLEAETAATRKKRPTSKAYDILLRQQLGGK